MTDQSELNKLLTAGINAAKNRDNATARELLQQVIEKEQYNEQAWFWLASVVDTDEERRTCLGNVVLINPANKKAQELLDQLEAKATGGGSSVPEVIIPGLDRRSSMIAIAVGAALILGLCTIFAVLSLGGGGDKDSGDNAAVANTTATDSITATPTHTLDPEQIALTPPTNTPFARATLPPVATHTPTSPPPEALPTLPSASVDLSGRLIISSGNELGSENYQPLFTYEFSTQLQNPATENQARGWAASASHSSSRYVFEQFNTGQREITIQIANINGTNSRNITEYWNSNPIIFFPAQPSWSPTGDIVAFVGRGAGMLQNDIYLIPVSAVPAVTTFNELGTPLPANEPSLLLQQLTSDAVEEQWPSWSPDGRFLVYAADTTQTGVNGTDLRVIETQTGRIQFLTSDTTALTESAPDWGGPNGEYIVYSAFGPGSDASDIWIIPAAEISSVFTPPIVEEPTNEADVPPIEGEVTLTPTEEPTATPSPEPTTDTPPEGPRLLIDLGPHDIRPIWSPDGRYIAFASDRSGGEFDIYVYDFETGEVFAVTQNPERVDVPHDWIP
ncbi:MAG: PD40 domain-containing protein [Anaerolineales bacterium]|nr:PD40 domain-containing protein [Anaerolineales bacterium]